MSDEKMLPCPFCGWVEPKLVTIRDGRVAQCPNCGARGAACFHGPSNMPSANSRAVLAWNTRTPSPDSGERMREALALKAIKAVTATAMDGAKALSRIMAIATSAGVKEQYSE